MAEPFVFCFSPGPGGHPEIMLILDLWCACGVCGHPQIQRFYHATPFHQLTLSALRTIAQSAHTRGGYECENCGSQTGPHDVGESVTRLAFADDAGELVAFASELSSVDEPLVQWQCSPARRLDPQIQPVRHPDEALQVHEELSGELVERVFGRCFGAKVCWRELAAEWAADPQGGAARQLSSDCWLVMDESPELAREWGEELELDEPWQLICLPVEGDFALPTHTHPAKISGRWQGWMPEQVRQKILDAEVTCAAWINPVPARQILERAFEVARLSFEVHEHAEDVIFGEIVTPRESAYPGEVSLQGIMHRALYTGMTPGEAARLTAEEIVGVLLGVWKT